MVTFFWIAFDAAISARMMMGGYAWWEVSLWGAFGLALAVAAWIVEHREAAKSDARIGELREELVRANSNTAGRLEMLMVLQAETHRKIDSQPGAPALEAFVGDLNTIAMRRGDSPNVSVIHLGLSIRNLGRPSAVHDWNVGYRTPEGEGMVLTSNVLMRTEFDETGKKGRNLAFDEEVYPERGIRSGFLAFTLSNTEAKDFIDARTSEIDIRFKDVAGKDYAIHWPPLELRQQIREHTREFNQRKGNAS
jgi:hypothetical protein